MLEVKQFPSDMSALELDRTDPKRCLVSGLFEESVNVGDTRRRFYTYIAPGLCSNQPCLVLAPPEDVPVLDFLEQGFWLDFAQEHQIFLHILESEDGKYRLDGTDAAYMNRVYVEIQSRKFYVTMQDNIYAAGIGGGAAVAQHAARSRRREHWQDRTGGQWRQGPASCLDGLGGKRRGKRVGVQLLEAPERRRRRGVFQPLDGRNLFSQPRV